MANTVIQPLARLQADPSTEATSEEGQGYLGGERSFVEFV